MCNTATDGNWPWWLGYRKVSSQNGNIMVKIKDADVDDEGISKKTISQPSHLGSFKIAFEKTNEWRYTGISWFSKNNKIYYSDPDSIYIQNDDYEILKTGGLIGKNLCHSKNDYSTCGLV